MSGVKRFFIVLSACFVVAILGWVVLIGAVYAWGGVATVRVDDPTEGVDIFVPVPMAIVEAAVTTAGWVSADEFRLGLQVEMDDWGPLVRELLTSLDDLPDATLVEVDDAGEHVRVYKERGSLCVDVDSEDVRVRVSLPVKSATRTLNRLARLI